MNKPKIALLIDLASLRVSCEGYKKLEAEIAQDYEIAYVKFYSYVAKRNRDFNEYIAAKGYDAVTPIASRRRNKLDTRQIIDATLLGRDSSLDAVAFAVGDGDIIPILTYLKSLGINVVDIDVVESPYIDAFNGGFYKVDSSYLREGYAAPAMKKAPAKRPVKKVVAPQPETRQESPYVNDVKALLARYKR